MSRYWRMFWTAAICLSAASTVAGEEKLRVQNDFGEALYFWIKSEAAKEWDRYLIPKDQSIQVPLAPSDKFQLVASDLRRGEYYTDLLPLLETIRANPDYILFLSSPFASNVPKRAEPRKDHDIVFLIGVPNNAPREFPTRQRSLSERILRRRQ